MANRTVKDAIYIKGTNPQYLIEKIIRTRIYDSRYWKEECFALTAELLVDKAMELKSVGGVYGGNVKPSPFLCLILKMLQIQPEKEIIIEFIRNEDFKYVRALGAFYMRLIATSGELYKYLEPLYIDYRKMKRMTKDAKYALVHMDEFIDELLHGERVCDISLPRIQKRYVLEDLNELEPRMSALEVNMDEGETSSSSSSSSESELESGEEGMDKDKDKERSREKRQSSRDRHVDSRSGAREDSRSRNNHRSERRSENRPPVKEARHRYVDYDNPDPADEMKRYKRSASPARKHARRSRSRSRHDDRHRRRGEADKDKDRETDKRKDREGNRSEKERNRERSLDRDQRPAEKRTHEKSVERPKERDRPHERETRRKRGDSNERQAPKKSGNEGGEETNDKVSKDRRVDRKKKTKHRRRSSNEPEKESD